MAHFPTIRLRRLRQSQKIRNLVRETRLSRQMLVMPYFVRAGKGLRKAISSLPGLEQLSPDEVLKEAKSLLKSGVSALMLFGIPEDKDPQGSAAYREDGVIQETLRLLKKQVPEMLVIADVCLCDYTDHGHCGLVTGEDRAKIIDNDSSLEILSKIAGSLARAGADIVAPSDMMDGRVQKIRDELDAAGFKELPILSYAVKYASSFYSPFRDALESAPQFGDRRSYQMDPANKREALSEAEQDLDEGADILMVKPALSSLDIVASLRDEFAVPIAAYQVSGEYAAIKFAAQHKALHEESAVLETWTAIRRAGADILVTYFARDYARLIPA